MSYSFFVTSVFIVICSVLVSATSMKPEKETDVNENYDSFLKALDLSVYYNEKTNQTLKQLPVPFVPGHRPSAKQPFINLCNCDSLRCSCCAGIRIYGLELDRQVCSIFTYEPLNMLIDVDFKLNNFTLYRGKFSTEEQQICVPVLPVALIRSVRFCMKLYDISVVDQRLHACLNMITMISDLPFVTLQFNCMEMGLDGVGVLRPGEVTQSNQPISVDNSTTTVTPPTTPITTQENQENSDVYNPVTDN